MGAIPKTTAIPGMFSGLASVPRSYQASRPSDFPANLDRLAARIEQRPVLLEYMLSSNDRSMNKAAVDFLVDYLRKRSTALPVLALLADWLDPTTKDGGEWKLRLSRRQRGRRRSIDQRATDFQLKAEFDQLRSGGLSRKVALFELATKHGLTDKGIEAAIARAKKT